MRYTVSDENTLVKQGKPICETGSGSEIMHGGDHGQSVGAPEVINQFKDSSLMTDIESARGFIKQK